MDLDRRLSSFSPRPRGWAHRYRRWTNHNLEVTTVWRNYDCPWTNEILAVSSSRSTNEILSILSVSTLELHVYIDQWKFSGFLSWLARNRHPTKIFKRSQSTWMISKTLLEARLCMNSPSECNKLRSLTFSMEINLSYLRVDMLGFLAQYLLIQHNYLLSPPSRRRARA